LCLRSGRGILGLEQELFPVVIVQVYGQLPFGLSALQRGDPLPVAWGMTDIHEIRLLFIK
jgi:hypothetical protein